MRDVLDLRRIGGQLLIVGGFNGLFPVGEHLVELFHQVVPLRGVKLSKVSLLFPSKGAGFSPLNSVSARSSQYQMW